MGAPSDQFPHLLRRPRSLCPFSYYMEAPRIISLHTILVHPDHFLRLLYGAPQISFFSYNMVAHISDQFHCLLYAPPPLRSVSLHAIGGPPQILVFSQNIWPPLRSVFPLTIWGPSDQFLCILFGGPSQISFFSYYMGSPQISFFAYYMGVP